MDCCACCGCSSQRLHAGCGVLILEEIEWRFSISSGSGPLTVLVQYPLWKKAIPSTKSLALGRVKHAYNLTTAKKIKKVFFCVHVRPHNRCYTCTGPCVSCRVALFFLPGTMRNQACFTISSSLPSDCTATDVCWDSDATEPNS